MTYIRTQVIPLILGLIIGALTTFTALSLTKDSDENRIADFYATETAVHISPHSIRKHMAEGDTSDFILVDLRSAEEYEKEHIISAVNIPAYTDPNTSAYDEVERIVSSFQTLKAENPEKDIIVYCYSTACMTGRKVGDMLADHDIYVKHLGIGWNEWRYDWNMWNHDGETPSTVDGYIYKGSEPGIPKPQEMISPCGEGELSC